MHLLFLHQNFPGQFGPLLSRLAQDHRYRLSFCHRGGTESIEGVEQIRYPKSGGATQSTHFYTRTIENIAHQSGAAATALAARPEIRPDLIIAHSGFVSFVPLQELYGCPVISYLEYFYHTRGGDMDFRPEQSPSFEERARARFRNASLLLDVEAATVGLSPTHWQRERFPACFQDKIEVIFDGYDPAVWYRRPRLHPQRRVGRLVIPDGVELVTYAARGFESMRGFDIFMAFAKKLYQRRPNVRFLVAGSDRVCYSGDLNRTAGKTFKEHVLAADSYDLSKFVFLKTMPPEHLAELFSISDLHVYLTAPFVLSWSLINAMACGATLLVSDTPPVREVISHEVEGLRTDFFDTDAMVANAEQVLNDPAGHRHLGEAAMKTAAARYSLDVTLPQHRKLFERVASGK